MGARASRRRRSGLDGSLPDRLASTRPKGEQLREILEQLVAALPAGTALPSERELAERYGVARMTVRGELDRLTGAGLTYRLQGRGTFVAEPRVAQANALSSFTEDMRARGMVPSSRVLARERVAAPIAIAARLGVRAGAELTRIARVRLADGNPMAVEEAFLPRARFPGLDGADLEAGSLFEFLRGADVELADADQRVVAVAIGPREARELDVDPGDPGLRFETLARDAAGAPVFFAVSLFRGDRYEIDLRQVRKR